MATILVDSHCPLSISKRIFDTKNGFTFSPSFLSGSVNDGTVCDNLMKFFKGHTDIKSVCLYDDWHREEFVTVNKARGTRKKFKLRTLCNGLDGTEETMNLDESTCDRRFLSELELLRAKMTCSDTGRMLLVIAWTSSKESKIFAAHPHVCSWDVTEGTNNEKRKLFIGLNYDATGPGNPRAS